MTERPACPPGPAKTVSRHRSRTANFFVMNRRGRPALCGMRIAIPAGTPENSPVSDAFTPPRFLLTILYNKEKEIYRNIVWPKSKPAMRSENNLSLPLTLSHVALPSFETIRRFPNTRSASRRIISAQVFCISLRKYYAPRFFGSANPIAAPRP